jgi:hypothetical protein
VARRELSVAFPAWLLGHDPAKHIMAVSNIQSLSDNLARESRTLMMSPFYQGLFDTRISKGREAVSDYETTAGGGRLSASVDGSLIGRGGDIIVVDDPLTPDEARSDVQRQKVNDWFDNTLGNRLNNQETGAIIIVMQRLDLVAHVQERESWDVLKFPAIAEQDETYPIITPYGRKLIQRKSGEILQPTRMSLETAEKRRQANGYNFAAQYQQEPQPPSGLIVKREWLKFYGKKDKPEIFDQVIQSWDTAIKGTEASNYSVCTT